MNDQVKKTPAVLVLGAWVFVGVPWGWGIVQLWKNASKLFQSPPPATATTVPVAAPAAPASSPAPATAAPSK